MLSEIRDIVDRQANNIAEKQTSSRTMVRRRKNASKYRKANFY